MILPRSHYHLLIDSGSLACQSIHITLESCLESYLLLRSRKLFINTVMDTVRQLNSAGLNCASRVEESAGSIQIILTLDHAAVSAAQNQS